MVSSKVGSHALKVVIVRALLSIFCLVVAPIFWFLLVVVALVKPTSVTKEMKGLLFFLLVVALLFVGGYITFTCR